MTVFLLPDEPAFPYAEEADPDGLIAIGGDLSVERLVQAYSQGIFPWFMDNEDIYWYSPDPRMILLPENFHVSKSLNRLLKSKKFVVRFDTDFESVIRSCSRVKRIEQDGTWISDEFIEGYLALHHHGIAHSVETYEGNQLVGGLYGVSLGRAFFGESMFYQTPNASKAALSILVGFCLKNRIKFIDCQMETNHLAKFGAQGVPRRDYLKLLKDAMNEPSLIGKWTDLPGNQ